MVQDIEKVKQDFPDSAPAAYPVFFRTYSRKLGGQRESWAQVCDRTLTGLKELGKLTDAEVKLINKMQQQVKSLTSGRWLWVGGTNWMEQSENFSGGYNCTSTNVIDWRAFGLMMDLAMMGCGTGAILEPEFINQLPVILNHLNIAIEGEVGSTPAEQRHDETAVEITENKVWIRVGDSRRGWVASYQTLLELSTDPRFTGEVNVTVNVSDVRASGEPLRGFGGVANPVKLPELYGRCANILNKAIGRKLNSIECCLLIDEAAVVVVAGNVRRSAGMRQGISDDELFANAKMNLWQQDKEGNWRIDPERDALRMANHTRVFHRKPTLEECIDAVRKQYYSGEGAIQWAGEAIARSNKDLLATPELKTAFLQSYEAGKGAEWLKENHPNLAKSEIVHRLQRYGLNPCHSGDTLVSTSKGLIPIKDLVDQQFQALVDLRSIGLQGVKLTNAIAFPTGVQVTSTITLSNGMQLRCTEDHQHFTQRGWVATKNLRLQEDEIYFQKGQGSFGKGTISARQSQMLGLWYANCVHTELETGTFYSFNEDDVSDPNKVYIPIIREVIKSLSQDHPMATVGESDGRYVVYTPFSLKQFLEQLQVQSREVLPVEFLRQSQEVIIGFLQGIFAGSGQFRCESKRHLLVLPNSSRTLLQQIQLLLLNLGVVSEIKSEHQLESYILKIATDTQSFKNFDEIVGYLAPSHQSTARDLLRKSSSKTQDEKFSSRVKQIQKNSEETVYDLTVPLTHSFIANGCITHNCGEILGADFHCVAGDTMLITRDGMHSIRSLVGKDVEIWNGKRWSQVRPILTGTHRKLYRVRFGDGSYLDVTGKHRFFVKDRFGKAYEEVTTLELAEKLQTSKYALHTEPFKIEYHDGKFVDPIQAYTLGQLVGDGSLCQSHGKPQLQLRLYGAKSHRQLAIAGRTSGVERFYAENKQTPCLLYVGFQDKFEPAHVRDLKESATAFDEMATWNRDSILHFVAGLADADGSEVPSGGIRIYLSDYTRAYRVYLLLLKCDIRSSINLAAEAGANTNLGIRKKDLWYLQITDCAAIPCQHLDTSRGHQPTAKGKWQIIDSVEVLQGVHDTFCFNEPEFHKGVFGGTLTGQCNLAEVHLNQMSPSNSEEQEEAFTAGALSVAALLNHKFQEPRYQISRELDPIVGVSFTGLFDFFVHAFGVEWLQWWAEGRPNTVKGLEFKEQEAAYLTRWRDIVHKAVWDYCDRHNLRRPNRCTTVQPAGTKSLLTGASPGWHPPKAQRFIRRITFRKNDPVALACIDYGYNIVPSQSDKDENGNLLHDPFDPRCTEWLVEIPVAVSWADLPGADRIDISKFDVMSQFDFYMQVQKFYTTHNTSATLELREPEIEKLGTRIYEAIRDDEGYISAALLARFDDLQTFPRLPFEPISKEQYDEAMQGVLARRQTSDFQASLTRYDAGYLVEAGPAGCDSDKCMLPDTAPNS